MRHLDLCFDLTATNSCWRPPDRSLGAEVTSPWFYLQLGLMLAGAGIAFAIGARGPLRESTSPRW
jgi:hypothetical protein